MTGKITVACEKEGCPHRQKVRVWPKRQVWQCSKCGTYQAIEGHEVKV